MSTFVKKQIQNIAVLLLGLIGLKNMFAALPFKFIEHFVMFYRSIINPEMTALHGILSFLTGLLMLLLAYRLYKRVRGAWIIEMIALSASIILQITRYHEFTIPIVLIELFVLAVLSFSYRDFSRRSDRVTVKWALILIAVFFLVISVHSAAGLYLIKGDLKNIETWEDAYESSINLLVLMDTSAIGTQSRRAVIYTDSLITINWICIIFSALLLLKPLVYNRLEDKYDKERVRKIILAHGQNPMSYLALENDKQYFFGTAVEGVCAYTVVRNVFTCCGDIICAKENGFLFLTELLSFCKQNGWELLLLNVTDDFLDLYRTAGFGIVKYGEDACFYLPEYNLAGGKVAKIRAAVNHAEKAGITVSEYKPTSGRNVSIEHAMQSISSEWLQEKGGMEMSFMLGGTGLHNPMERRYFYAADPQGVMLGFVVFLPYLNGRAYLADVTRRRKNAPQGVIEKIIYDAFMQMKEEGSLWGNMGLSPLYNVAEGDKVAVTEMLFSFIYNRMNNAYNFKALHHSKEKFAPTHWQTRYLAYLPKPFSPAYAYAIVKAQIPNGIKDIVFTELLKRVRSDGQA